MFVRHFESRARQERYDRFVARYHEFHPDDVVLICDSHHEEIHQLYLPIIDTHRKRVRKPMATWTWRQAEILMDALRRECTDWLSKETPGGVWIR